MDPIQTKRNIPNKTAKIVFNTDHFLILNVLTRSHTPKIEIINIDIMADRKKMGIDSSPFVLLYMFQVNNI